MILYPTIISILDSSLSVSHQKKQDDSVVQNIQKQSTLPSLLSPSPPQNDSNEHSSSSPPPGVNANDDKNDSNNRPASREDTAKYNQDYNERGKVEKEQRMRLHEVELRYERQQQRSQMRRNSNKGRTACGEIDEVPIVEILEDDYDDEEAKTSYQQATIHSY